MVKPRERMAAVLAEQETDRYPFVPSMYEHGARLLGLTPGEVSRSSDLMAQAALATYETYHHDLVTVGVDIYNIEAEAFGCRVSDGSGSSVPGVEFHPLADAEIPAIDSLALPTPGSGNRLQLITDAAGRVAEKLRDEVWVYACMGGPFSQAVELRGFENLVFDTLSQPERIHELLQKTTALSIEQARRLSAQGCGVNVFESWATLPLITVEMFREFVVPYNRTIVEAIRREFSTPPPAIIMGGDTARLMDCFIEVGTSLVVADFNTDFSFMRRKTRGKKMIVRGCADPKMIERGDWKGIEESLRTLSAKAAGMRNFVWGCGAVSYDTTTEDLLHFKQLCLDMEQR